MIEAQDYTSLQLMQSQETLQDYNQSLETAQYSTPYFMSKEELPQFAGELSPYSNFHHSPFVVNGQRFHSSEQWVQYQKALTFGDSYTANQILQCETPLECKKLSYNINGVDREKWMSVGYDICFDGIREKFLQNPPLLVQNNVTKNLSRGND